MTTDGGSGNGYWRDWNPSGVVWTSENTTTHPVTGGFLNSSWNNSGGYYQISLFATSAGDMTYTITLPIFDDKLYDNFEADEGIYNVEIRLNNGKKFTDKIIVREDPLKSN